MLWKNRLGPAQRQPAELPAPGLCACFSPLRKTKSRISIPSIRDGLLIYTYVFLPINQKFKLRFLHFPLN